ncbi:helix-turn-helix transcriptional regulator [Lactococcus garvieae]|uniref:helix-turn-helix domain-containing protein n=1 Tax=Lactococcus garvieae TaxID=1363 RepID=UPI0020981967|nr:helix-turn-helix transcriptional regulator [Lactococcus garvieae]MCO7128577.1 helix-turn-helix transcriptional regulator [Lactococcus garvieae]
MKKTKLQIMREKKGLTRIDLASKICSLNEFENLEGDIAEEIEGHELGLIKLSLRQLGFIAQVLGCSIDELVED